MVVFRWMWSKIKSILLIERIQEIPRDAENLEDEGQL